MRRSQLRSLVAGAAVAGQLGCSILSDPAVRLADCTRRSSPTDLTLFCDPDVRGGYLAVLHPPGELSSRELLAAGVPPEYLATVGQLRIGSNAAIYVVPFSRSRRPSRTTSQMHHVLIPKVIVVQVAPGNALQLVLGSDADGLSVVAAEAVPR